MFWRADSFCCGMFTRPELPASVPSSRYCEIEAEGMSLIELLIGCAAMSVLVGMAVPSLMATRDDWSARAAARYVAGRAMLARAQAVRRGAAVGLRFESTGDGYRFGSYIDGDGDGIRTADIDGGVDLELDPAQRLSDLYPTVRFALESALPPVEGAHPAGIGFDPIRLGASDILTYTPFGTSSSGSLYLRSQGGQQYAIRILGTTGRLRVMRFDWAAGAWSER